MKTVARQPVMALQDIKPVAVRKTNTVNDLMTIDFNQFTSFNSSHLEVYLGLLNSWRIFQLRLVPLAANFKISSRILKL
ncbi:MAG: hypothetical protein ABIO81_05285, partial [Ginsengibacter sp.]